MAQGCVAALLSLAAWEGTPSCLWLQAAPPPYPLHFQQIEGRSEPAHRGPWSCVAAPFHWSEFCQVTMASAKEAGKCPVVAGRLQVWAVELYQL